MQKITPCLWFDDQAEDAVKYYLSVFKNGAIKQITYYGKDGYEIHKKQEGSVMTVVFEFNGERYMALNGGPEFKFNEAISLMVHCETQEEIDYFWEKLSAGGEQGPCGWLKDKFGVSWQIVPAIMGQLLSSPEKTGKIMKVLLKMKKLDIALLESAAKTS